MWSKWADYFWAWCDALYRFISIWKCSNLAGFGRKWKNSSGASGQITREMVVGFFGVDFVDMR